MTNGIDLANIERRAKTAGYQDGLTELFAACVLLAIGVMWIASPAFVGIMSAFIVLFGWKVVERVKEKITYPRIGYFQERPEAPDTTARGMLSFIAISFGMMVGAVVLSGDIGDAAEWRRAAPVMSGIMLAGAFWYVGYRSGFVRHRFIAVYAAVTGIVLWLVGTGESYETMVWHLLSLAALLAAFGTWGLIHFLRTNHPQNIADDV